MSIRFDTAGWKVKFKFDHTNKSFMHNPESVLENETHPILCDFDLQTDHLILARRSDLVIENMSNSTLCRSASSQGKTEIK